MILFYEGTTAAGIPLNDEKFGMLYGMTMSKYVLRTFEKELDEYYKTFQIYNHPTDAKLYALLASYDSMLLPYIIAGGPIKDSPGMALQFKTLDDSLTYCLRWLCERKPKNLVSTSSTEIITLTDELLSFGANYADIADMHMMYGRNLVELDIDAHLKKVRFKIKDEDTNKKEIHGFLQTHEFHRKIGARNEQKNRQLAVECIQAIAQIKIKYKNGTIIINDISQLNNPKIKNLVEKELSTELLSLDNTTDLGGFTFGEYSQFWLAISNWSNCLLSLFLLSVKKGVDQSECMPTQLLQDEEFVSDMKILSGLQEQTITGITERLTYDFQNQKAEILLQPFIRLNRCVLWSPLIIRKSRWQRNILKLMSRTPELKEISDNIIGEREKNFLNRIGDFLSRRSGYQFKLNTDISNQGLCGEIDLLAYKTKDASEILVIEAKTILAVDETNEIADATDKLINAQEQINQAVTILKSMDNEKKKELFKFVNWDKVSDYYPVIMTPDSHPNTLYNDDIVPHISYTSLLTFARSRDFSRPSRLWGFCKEKEWLQERLPEKNYGYKDIEVGDITYSLPYIRIRRSSGNPSEGN